MKTLILSFGALLLLSVAPPAWSQDPPEKPTSAAPRAAETPPEKSEPAPRQGIGRPGGLTTAQRPPQCTPPNPPSDHGSPQPSLPQPGLTATPVSPPDGGCELTELPLRPRLQEVEDPALRSALLALRGDVEALARTRPDDARAVSAARQRIQRDLSAVSRAARSGDYRDAAGRCESARTQCERACGGRDCCCCTATFVNCLLAP